MAKVSEALLDFYKNTYDDVSVGWRKVGAIYKAQHIMDLCERNGLKPKRILEYGAGTGDILKVLSEADFAEEYYAVEISEGSVEHIKGNNIKNLKEVKTFDGYDTGYEDDSFDLVYMSHVLEHVEFERSALRELKRLSAHHIVEVPLDYSHRVDMNYEHFLAYGHINIYTAPLVRFLLLSEGFAIDDSEANLTASAVREYQMFDLKQMREDTPENREEARAQFAEEQKAYDELPLLERELRGRDIAILTSRRPEE